MANQLIKVNYEDIWSPHQHTSYRQKGRLYRGNTQKIFESRLIETTLEGNPTYWGTVDNHEKITFCSAVYHDSLFYTNHWLTKFDEAEYEAERSFPHAFFPLAMEINAENYQDRIYKSTAGEGLIIKGPISLDDITILYSTRIDRLIERQPRKDVEKERKNFASQKQAFEKMLETRGITRNDLLDAYDKNPRQVTNFILYFYYHVNPANANHHHLTNVQKNLANLRAMLR
jgi:hypothetical protein